MNKVVRRAGAMLLLVLILTGGMAFFVADYIINSEKWILHAGSPHVYMDYSNVCGVVTDRSGKLLMDTTSGRVYSDDALLRSSVIHWLGDRQGNISVPMLHYYAKKMTSYDVINGLYRYGNEGGTITLTISAAVQKAALEAMGSYKGTVAVYNYKTGEILCAVSTPAYDPDNVPDIAGDPVKYEGAYLNRFLQSAYTPGSIFKIITLAAALENLEDPDSWSYTCSGKKEYGIDQVSCLRQHGTQNLQEAFCNSCNCAFAQLADGLGAEVLQAYADAMGVTGSVAFDGINTVPGQLSVTGEADVMVAWSAIGQHKDLINPCQFLNMVGAIASGGSGAGMHIVSKIDGGEWGSYTAQTEETQPILSPETAEKLQQMLRYNVQNYYGDSNFPGLTVCAKSGTAEVGNKNNSLFVGFVENEEYPLAFIAVVEDGSYGRVTCIPILSKVLAACKEVMDGE